MLKHSHKLSDYNFRSYAVRRTKQGFREGTQASSVEAARMYDFGVKQVEVVRRQSIISNLFPGDNSVLSISHGKNHAHTLSQDH
jgi:hypothetical protein